MKVEVNVPEGRFCTGCPLLRGIVLSWGYEELGYRCGYLKKDIPFDQYKQKLVRKHKDCPAAVMK